MLLTALLLAQATTLPALPDAEPAGVDPTATVAAIETAHAADAYYAKPAIKADVLVEFGGEVRHDGPVWFTPPAGQARLESGGKTIVFDGSDVYVSPADAKAGGERFAALTWPYFLAAPYKLSDGGAVLADGGARPLDGEPEPAVLMTFEAGTGDTPDDWYLIWTNEDDTLEALAYIVTYFPGREPVPHVAVYDEYEVVDGVPMVKQISFYDWNDEDGTNGDKIGQVTVRSLSFEEPPAGAFEAPEDAAVDELPTAE